MLPLTKKCLFTELNKALETIRSVRSETVVGVGGLPIGTGPVEINHEDDQSTKKIESHGDKFGCLRGLTSLNIPCSKGNAETFVTLWIPKLM